MDNTRLIDLDIIDDNPYQTRQFRGQEHIVNLADDIKQNGLLQVPIGRFVDEDRNLAISHYIEDYSKIRIQLAFGHNRREAYRLLANEDPSFKKMPVFIRNLKDEEMALLAWSENETRKQLDPIERARAIQRFTVSFGWTQQTIAEKIHLDRSTVANLIRLLNLPDVILGDIQLGILSQRQAMALIPIYELSQTQSIALNQNAGFCEFVSLARSGQLSSDTIRDKASVYVDSVGHLTNKQLSFDDMQPDLEPEPVIESAPATIEEAPVLVIHEDTQEEAENNPVNSPEPVEANIAADIESENENVCTQTIPEPEAEPVKASEPAPQPVQPAPQPEPVPMPTPNNSITFSITWNGTMAMCGLRKGDEKPLIQAKFNLADEQIPGVIADMRKLLSIG